tara:strand:+ start:116 stop:226 length:111 start_codon:yes stop_codon:yes gene_type:complete
MSLEELPTGSSFVETARAVIARAAVAASTGDNPVAK